jgi:hypothetical protein
MSSYRRALSVYDELDTPRRLAQLSLTAVSKMGGECRIRARPAAPGAQACQPVRDVRVGTGG